MLKKRIIETDFGDKVLVNIYLNPKEFLDKVKAGRRYKLCFSDVMMLEMDGMKLEEEIRKIDGRMLLVFLSSYVEYAPDGYSINAFDYLLKGRENDKWDTLVNRIRKRLEDDKVKVYRVIAKNKVELIPLNRIIYIFTEEKYLKGIESLRYPWWNRMYCQKNRCKYKDNEVTASYVGYYKN